MMGWLIGAGAVLIITATALVTVEIERTVLRRGGSRSFGPPGAAPRIEQPAVVTADNSWLTRIVSTFDD